MTGSVRFRLRAEARRDLVTKAVSAQLEELGCNVTSLDEVQLTFRAAAFPATEEVEYLRRVSSGRVRLLERKHELIVQFRLVERDLLSFLAVALIPVAWVLSDLFEPRVAVLWVLGLLTVLLLQFLVPSESRKGFSQLIERAVESVPGIDAAAKVA